MYLLFVRAGKASGMSDASELTSGILKTAVELNPINQIGNLMGGMFGGMKNLS